MKRDLILISAFCNNEYKTNTLRNLVNSLKRFDRFDIMITSHSTIPQDIVSSVQYYFYDYKNTLLEDFDLRSASWFDPNGDGMINSIFVGFSNTHLASARLIIFGNTLAKALGYEKVHHLEYDSFVDNEGELLDNSNLLENNDAVTYKIDDTNHNGLLLGSFQSYKISTLCEKLLNYNEESFLKMIRDSNVKSPELFLKNMLHDGKKYVEKNIKNFELTGMKFAYSKNKPEFPAWCLPYHDRKTNKLFFIIWNIEGIQPLNLKLIYNSNNIHSINEINPNIWRIIDLGNYDDTNELIVLVNNKVRNVYDFSKIRDQFKYYSYR